MHTVHSATTDSISPIRVSPNGRYFVDPAGRPVFWLGDTQWELFRLFAPEGALRILRDRQAKGFNIILIMLLGVNTTRFGRDEQAPYTNLEGETPWADGDPLRPNERYFEHVDAMVRLGEQTGQTFVVGVYHQWQVDMITVEKARAWARWVAHRYRDAPNLIWSMYPKATADYIPVCRELAAGLQAGDGGAHLISVHPDPAVASSSFIHDEPWLAFNMIQTCTRYEQIPEAVAADYGRTPVKPAVMAEGGYEGLEFRRLQTAHHIRKQAYWSQLAGGHHIYGHNEHWTAPTAVAQWLDSPGSQHLRIFQEVMTAIDGWWDLAPDASILASGAGSGDRLNLAARSTEGRWVVVYLSEASTVSVRLDAITAGSRVRAWWIDPTCGDRQSAGSFDAQGAQSFTSPQGWEDALLYVAV